jgi:hypothetical protein
MVVKYLRNRLVTKSAGEGKRSVKLTQKNAGPVSAWLGDALIQLDLVAKGGAKIKLKTPKGVRVANLDDVIIKHGTRRNNGKVTFTVEKAS